MENLHVFIQGRVQGVGFRFATQARAQSLGLTGWVRNLPDERVEAVFEGPRQVLEDMLAWCRKGPPMAHVSHVDYEWKQARNEFTVFSIR